MRKEDTGRIKRRANDTNNEHIDINIHTNCRHNTELIVIEPIPIPVVNTPTIQMDHSLSSVEMVKSRLGAEINT